MYLREMSTICLKPLRIAFDHIGVRKPYETAIRYATEFGLTELSNYMLYNFHDTPQDLYERMALNISLNENLGTRIFSFPMRYQPTDMKDRTHVGPNWTRFQLRSMQIILQATHGIVSGTPDFFRRAFGASVEEFERLLARPEKFVFNRIWYEELGGRDEFHAFKREYDALNADERAELLHLLSSTIPSGYTALVSRTVNDRIRSILHWYKPLSDDEELSIWKRAAAAHPLQRRAGAEVPDDELVEDAGLAVPA
jgi:hypothetical protein